MTRKTTRKEFLKIFGEFDPEWEKLYEDEPIVKEIHQGARDWWADNPDFKPALGMKHTDGAKEKIADWHRDKIVSDETKEKHRENMMGNTHGAGNKGQVRKPESEKYNTIYMREYRKGIKRGYNEASIGNAGNNKDGS
jgi:hypothetical protein